MLIDAEALEENDRFISETTHVQTSRQAEGWVCILLVVVIWVAASFLVQNIESSFHAPFFLTFSCTAMFTVFFLFAHVASVINGSSNVGAFGIPNNDLSRLRIIGLKLAPLWFLANFFYILSLSKTSVASSTILSSTSSVFTLIIGYILKSERIVRWQVAGVVVCFLGSVIVGFSDKSKGSEESFYGDLLSLVSAVLYACYSVVLSVSCDSSPSVRMDLLLAFVGMWNLIFCAPIVIALDLLSMESLNTLTWEVASQILVKGITDNVIADYLWARAVLLTSPTITTVGLSLTIPLSAVADLFVYQKVPTVLTIIGACFVTVGFLCVSICS